MKTNQIIVSVSGGVITGVENVPPGFEVVINDYDTQGIAHFDDYTPELIEHYGLAQDEKGDWHTTEIHTCDDPNQTNLIQLMIDVNQRFFLSDAPEELRMKLLAVCLKYSAKPTISLA